MVENRGVFNLGIQLFGNAEIVDAPTDIALPRPRSVRPPTVTFGRLRVQVAKTINESSFEDSVKTRTFFIRKSRVFSVRLGVGEINFGVGHVEVAAEDDGFALFQLF